MCGITGFWNLAGRETDRDAPERIARMTEALRHRGPDAGDVWLDPGAGLALGHRRLSVIDLSQAGAQPMASHDGRYVIVYNGEVYNANALREAVERKRGQALAWRGHSDTEAILEHWAVFGGQPTVKALVGMFAFAVWDRQERSLTLARDRFGVKPLYWGLFGDDLLFGSELKPLHRHPAFRAEIDRDSLAAYVWFNHVPDPRCIFKRVRKLEPGCLLVCRQGRPPCLERYWSALEIAVAGMRDRIDDEEEAVARLRVLLHDSIRCRMTADVPLGAFLSGGIDSSLVTAIMQQEATAPVKTFSMGFHEGGFDEAPFARAVASHLGTDHTECYVTSAQAWEVIPLLPQLFDEPFADSSQIPTFLVSQLARREVTIALTGDGGDEVFAGYGRYFDWPQCRGAAYMRRFMAYWPDPAQLVLGGAPPPTIHSDPFLDALFADPMELKQYIDTVTYLPGDILVKVDRASMGVSLETRPPLLDHRLFALAWRLPAAVRRKGNQGKWPLRRILGEYIPPHLFERPKMGFGIPIDQWLRGTLRPWAATLLDHDRLRREGFFNPVPVGEAWERHQRGEDHSYLLWVILMFQAWLDASMGTATECGPIHVR